MVCAYVHIVVLCISHVHPALTLPGLFSLVSDCLFCGVNEVWWHVYTQESLNRIGLISLCCLPASPSQKTHQIVLFNIQIHTYYFPVWLGRPVICLSRPTYGNGSDLPSDPIFGLFVHNIFIHNIAAQCTLSLTSLTIKDSKINPT